MCLKIFLLIWNFLKFFRAQIFTYSEQDYENLFTYVHVHLDSDVPTTNMENKRFLRSLPALLPALDFWDASQPIIMYSALQSALCSLSWCVVLRYDTQYGSLTTSNGAEGLLHLFYRSDFSLDPAESNVCLDPNPVCQHRLTFSLWPVPTPPNPGVFFPTLRSNGCRAALSYRKPLCKDHEWWRNGRQAVAWLTCFYHIAAGAWMLG